MRIVTCRDSNDREVNGRLCNSGQQLEERRKCNEHLCTKWKFESWSEVKTILDVFLFWLNCLILLFVCVCVGVLVCSHYLFTRVPNIIVSVFANLRRCSCNEKGHVRR